MLLSFRFVSLCYLAGCGAVRLQIFTRLEESVDNAILFRCCGAAGATEKFRLSGKHSRFAVSVFNTLLQAYNVNVSPSLAPECFEMA